MILESDKVRLARKSARVSCLSLEKRIDTIMHSAQKAFLADGFVKASISRIAADACISTRTIYEHYSNKVALFEAVVQRMLSRTASQASALVIDSVEPAAALLLVAQELIACARDNQSAALFRLVASESARFPTLAARMREARNQGVTAALADYLRRGGERFALRIADGDHAAKLFRHMILGHIEEVWLTSGPEALRDLDMATHVSFVINVFLRGAASENLPKIAQEPQEFGRSTL